MNKIKTVCPVCSLPIYESEQTKACPNCETVYHANCWIKNGGCATFACPQKPYLPTERSGFVICSQCGEEWPESKKFCAKCGMRLEKPLAKAMPIGAVSCPKCGTTALPGNKFCIKCGTKLESTESGDDRVSSVDSSRCRSCGAPLKPGKKFCTSCGAAIEQ